LLIDSDTGFHDALAQQLGRYRLSVAAEADPEDALAMAISDGFDVVMIAVEEPEKLGFKTFQKARKQLPAKVPIVLVTASLSPEAFAKHRGLKTHADAYIDKRNGEPEVFQKLDALLELGDPVADDELPPGDDIPMEIGDGDVVLDEEQMDEDPHGGFEHTMATVNPGSGVMIDKMVSAETDAAFDALLGDDMFGGGDAAPAAPVEAAAPAAAPVEVVEDAAPEPVDAGAPETLSAEESAIPEPVPHKIPEPEDDGIPVGNEDFDMDSVPAAIIDDGGAKSGAFSNAALAVPPPEAVEPIEDDSLAIPSEGDGATVIGQVAQADSADDDANNDFVEESQSLSSRDSLSSIPIVDDDLVSLDDEMPVEVEAEDVADDAMEEQPAPAPEPEPEPVPVAAIPQPLAAMPAAAATESKTKSAGHPAVDLGLDDIAENAEREQSGVYDRKSLRQIGELERTIAQL
jgi:CheY-like chemotaxis protein